MAKFCSRCGRPLNEGEVCNCAPVVQQSAPVAPQTVAVSAAPAQAAGSIDIKGCLMDCVNIFKKIFTKPVEAIKEFVNDNNFVAGIIMIVVSALITGLYRMAALKSIYSGTFLKPDYLKEFMNVFLPTIGEYALIAIIGYLIVSKLFKGTATIKQIVTAVGISLSVIIVTNVINSALVFMDGEFIVSLRTYIASFASILNVIILYASIKHAAGIDENKLFIGVTSIFVFASVAIDLIQKMFD